MSLNRAPALLLALGSAAVTPGVVMAEVLELEVDTQTQTSASLSA